MERGRSVRRAGEVGTFSHAVGHRAAGDARVLRGDGAILRVFDDETRLRGEIQAALCRVEERWVWLHGVAIRAAKDPRETMVDA